MVGEILKTLGIATIAMGAAYVAANKVDKYIEEKGKFEHSQECSNILKVCTTQMIGMVAFAADRCI